MVMMGIDNLCILLIALFVLRGWWLGAIRTITSVLGTILAYVASYLLHRPVGALLAPMLSVSELIGTVIAGLCIFMFVSLAATIAGYFYMRRRLAKAKDADVERAKDRENGIVLGLIHGALVAFFVLLALSLAPPGSSIDRTLGVSQSEMVSWVRTISPGLFETLWARATGDQTSARILAGALRDPEGAREAARDIMTSPRLKELHSDPSFAEDLQKKSPEQLARDPRIMALTEDPQIRGALKRMGLKDEDLEYSPEEAAQAIGKVQVIMERFQSMMKNAGDGDGLPAGLSAPDLQRALEQGDYQRIMQEMGTINTLMMGLEEPGGKLDK